MCIMLQSNAQSSFNVYQGNVVLKSIPTSQVDSITVSEAEPRIVSFWHDGSVLQSYYTEEVDSITVVNDVDPLAYMGIVGYNGELYKRAPDILATSTSSLFKSFVNNLPRQNGTLLYYAVDNALDMIGTSDISTPLSSVHLVTFTDGLDQGSLMMNPQYSSSKGYLDAVSGLIADSKYYGLPVNAYSIGLRGNDVSDIETFRNNLSRLASSADKSFEVGSVDELQTMFQDIANQIINVNTRQTMSFKIPGIDSGTRVRFVFDGQPAESSSLYIEGTFDFGSLTLRDVTYHGLKSRSGRVVQGTLDGIFVTFTFLGLQGADASLPIPTSVGHYYMLPSSSTWQLNSEFSSDNSTQRCVSHSGTVIILVLDCSNSLGDDFSQVKTYANKFIDIIAQNAQPFEMKAPENAQAALDDEAFNIVVSWDAVRHAEGYQVYRSGSSSGSYVLVADDITSTTWTDTAPLSSNYYRVKTLGHGLTSGYSNTTDAIIIDLSGSIDGHDYVDLGLPSGTLWATCNVGATSPEGYGNYYAWGETTTKSTYSSGTYTYSGYPTELPTSADVAYVTWGSNWRMPSLAQFQELINSSYTTTTWTTLNGFYGRLITSKLNGNSIFLPAAGYGYDSSLYYGGSRGCYWSRRLNTLYTSHAYDLYFNSGTVGTDYEYDRSNYRYVGHSVRPVRFSE